MIDPDVVSAIAESVTALGVGFLAYQTVLMKHNARDEHDRSRREFTIQLIHQWCSESNPYTATAARVVKDLAPEICDGIVKLQPVKVPLRYRSLLETSLAEVVAPGQLEVEGDTVVLREREVARLRYLVVNYLNRTETVLAAWHIACADDEMIKAEFRDIGEEFDYVLQTFRSKLDSALSPAYPAIDAFVAELKRARAAVAPPKRSPLPK
jgi:hypothetical protein